jgi:hypothetical protein
LRIQLDGVRPAIWRRVLVPGIIRLGKLHDILQIAMGWEDSHLHCFEIGGERYGTQDDEHPLEEIDENDVYILEALGDTGRFVYEYDYGDGWEHKIVVEAMSTTPAALKFAVCLDGKNACPPEDCGGVYGYGHLLHVLADPSHEEHEDLMTWMGGPFDPTAFDLAAINAELQRLR